MRNETVGRCESKVKLIANRGELKVKGDFRGRRETFRINH